VFYRKFFGRGIVPLRLHYLPLVYTETSGFSMGTIDLIFPKKCLGCGKIGGYFCLDCLNLVSLEPKRICPVCLKPSFGGLTHPGCGTTQSLDGLTSVVAYKGVIKKAITKLKYKFVSDLAQDLVELFLSFCGEDKVFTYLCQPKGITLIPIPLHPSRKRWRGFNQAELLGKMIASNLDLKFLPDVLKRVKKTKPQVKLDKEGRKENIRGAFELNPNYKLLIANSSFILFDDVWTSGATLKEATKVLKRNGVKEVWGLTLAR
jgi:competence protein ComFC